MLKIAPEHSIVPYSLSIKAAADHFGFAKQTLYQWINSGKLLRGTHYLKIGKKVIIIREAFIRWLNSEDSYDGNQETREKTGYRF